MRLPAEIFVRFTLPAIHCWKDATDNRAYLKHPHRHTFHFEVRMEVGHNDREVEFHDLMLQCQLFISKNWDSEGPFPDHIDFKGRSCEMIAGELGEYVATLYKRLCTVVVSEDGEAGASVCCIPNE